MRGGTFLQNSQLHFFRLIARAFSRRLGLAEEALRDETLACSWCRIEILLFEEVPPCNSMAADHTDTQFWAWKATLDTACPWKR